MFRNDSRLPSQHGNLWLCVFRRLLGSHTGLLRESVHPVHAWDIHLCRQRLGGLHRSGLAGGDDLCEHDTRLPRVVWPMWMFEFDPVRVSVCLDAGMQYDEQHVRPMFDGGGLCLRDGQTSMRGSQQYLRGVSDGRRLRFASWDTTVQHDNQSLCGLSYTSRLLGDDARVQR